MFVYPNDSQEHQFCCCATQQWLASYTFSAIGCLQLTAEAIPYLLKVKSNNFLSFTYCGADMSQATAAEFNQTETLRLLKDLKERIVQIRGQL